MRSRHELVVRGSFVLASIFGIFGGYAHAIPFTASGVNGLVTNPESIGGSSHPVNLSGGENNNSASATTASGGFFEDFGGFDSFGNPSTLFIEASGRSTSDYGTLGAEISFAFQTPLPTSTNSPLVLDPNTVDPNGVPSRMEIVSRSSFSDTLSVTGGPGLLEIVFDFELSGNYGSVLANFPPSGITEEVSRTDLLHGTQVTVLQDVFTTLFSEDGRTQSVDTNPFDPDDQESVQETVFSQPISVVNGEASIRLDLVLSGFLDVSEIDTSLFGPLETDLDFRGVVDFSNTFDFVGVTGFDENGSEVQLSQVVGQSGTVFLQNNTQPDPITVPSPGGVTLFSIGVLGVFALRFRKKNGVRVYLLNAFLPARSSPNRETRLGR